MGHGLRASVGMLIAPLVRRGGPSSRHLPPSPVPALTRSTVSTTSTLAAPLKEMMSGLRDSSMRMESACDTDRCRSLIAFFGEDTGS